MVKVRGWNLNRENSQTDSEKLARPSVSDFIEIVAILQSCQVTRASLNVLDQPESLHRRCTGANLLHPVEFNAIPQPRFFEAWASDVTPAAFSSPEIFVNFQRSAWPCSWTLTSHFHHRTQWKKKAYMIRDHGLGVQVFNVDLSKKFLKHITLVDVWPLRQLSATRQWPSELLDRSCPSGLRTRCVRVCEGWRLRSEQSGWAGYDVCCLSRRSSTLLPCLFAVHSHQHSRYHDNSVRLTSCTLSRWQSRDLGRRQFWAKESFLFSVRRGRPVSGELH